jgi:zinc/manganese transport system substrate-binding protein
MRSALLLIPALLLAGCATTPAIDDGRVHVVASTNVYGSIVDAIGGDLVTVTSLIGGAYRQGRSRDRERRRL